MTTKLFPISSAYHLFANGNYTPYDGSYTNQATNDMWCTIRSDVEILKEVRDLILVSIDVTNINIVEWINKAATALNTYVNKKCGLSYSDNRLLKSIVHTALLDVNWKEIVVQYLYMMHTPFNFELCLADLLLRCNPLIIDPKWVNVGTYPNYLGDKPIYSIRLQPQFLDMQRTPTAKMETEEFLPEDLTETILDAIKCWCQDMSYMYNTFEVSYSDPNYPHEIRINGIIWYEIIVEKDANPFPSNTPITIDIVPLKKQDLYED